MKSKSAKNKIPRSHKSITKNKKLSVFPHASVTYVSWTYASSKNKWKIKENLKRYKWFVQVAWTSQAKTLDAKRIEANSYWKRRVYHEAVSQQA